MLNGLAAKVRSAIGGDRDVRDIVGKGSVALTLNVLGLGVSYAFTLLVTRLSGANAWGVFALCLAAINVLVILGKLGLDVASLRLIAQLSGEQRYDAVRAAIARALRVLVPWCLVLSIAFWVLAPVLAREVFGKPQLSEPFRLGAAAILPLALLSFSAESLRGFKMIAGFAFFQHVAKFLAAVLVFLALYVWLGYRADTTPVLAFVIGAFVVAALACATLFARIRAYPRVPSAGPGTRELVRLAFPLMMSNSILFLMAWTDTLILGAFRPEAEVAYYNVAVKLAALTAFTINAVNSIVAPRFAELYFGDDKPAFAALVRNSTRIIFFATLPVAVGLLVFRRPLLEIFGAGFATASLALLLITVGQVVSALSGSVGYILQMTGRANVLQNILLLSLGLKIVLSLTLIPSYGMNGAAFASMLGLAVWNLTAVGYIRWRYGLLTFYVPFAKGNAGA